MPGLTKPRETFAAGLAEGLSQSEAYRRAYPSALRWTDASVWQVASRLAADVRVASRVAELKEATGRASEVKLQHIAAELARLAFFDVRRLVNADGTPKNLHEIDEDTARAIAGIDVVSVGNAELGVGQVLKFKLADKGANLERLAKLLGMFVERAKVTHDVGADAAAAVRAAMAHLFTPPPGGGKGDA